MTELENDLLLSSILNKDDNNCSKAINEASSFTNLIQDLIFKVKEDGYTLDKINTISSMNLSAN